MPYYCDLGPGQKIYLDNPGPITLITLASGSAGQQQQSSTQVHTGPWTEVPQIARVGSGVLLRCVTAQGTYTWQIQGMQIGIAPTNTWAADQATPMQATEVGPSSMAPMQPMAPMEPMAPMRMGDMQMSMNPMTMRMGNMTLGLDAPAANTQQFCTQCGAAIAWGDRFCGSCGHQLH